jgi:hypothetical protein
MTKSTRNFMLASTGIMIGGLCVGLAAYYGGLPTGAFAPVIAAEDELKYLPADATVVAYADVKQIMSSEFRRRLQNATKEQGQDEFERETGIRIESDIDSVAACLKPGDGKDPDGVVVVRGRFDVVRLEALALEHGGTVETYKDIRIIKHNRPESPARDQSSQSAHGGPRHALAFLEPGLIGLGSVGALKAAVDTKTGGASILTNAELAGGVREVQGSGNAWAVGRLDAAGLQAKLPSEVASRLPPIDTFSSVFQINGGVSAVLRAEARDEQAAQNLRDVIKGGMALAKLQSGAEPALESFLQSLQLGGAGKSVSLSFSLPAEVFDVLEKMGKSSGNQKRGEP